LFFVSQQQTNPSEFEREAQARRRGFFGELWGFLRENKKWWLIPLVVTILLIGLLVFLAGTGTAPFIYTLF
jgi:hypothetical protein